MKTTHALTLGAALLLASLTSTLAQSTWQTVDELTPWRGRDIVADNAGNFFSLAIDNGATGSTGVVSTAVSVSTDHGATWQTVGSIGGYALDLAVAPDGALFAAGNRSATVSGRAFLWQSLDSGPTWTEIDPWAGQSGTFLSLDVAAGNNGSIYLCGYLYGGGKWIVRRGDRTHGGINWTTVDSFAGTQAESICVRPPTLAGQPDEVLVSGFAGGLWTIRRSADGGATWATVDSYSTGFSNAGYSGVAAGLEGSIYTVARNAKSVTVTNWTVVRKKLVATVTTTTEYGWLVRKSANDGASWANVGYFANGWPGNGPITVDNFGRVFVAGFNNTTPRTWLVRGSEDGGVTWVTTDSFLPPGTTSAQAQAIASDALGNVCVVGETGTSASTYTAPVRRLAAP
jgi:hypothetical protein